MHSSGTRRKQVTNSAGWNARRRGVSGLTPGIFRTDRLRFRTDGMPEAAARFVARAVALAAPGNAG